jgi:hypothetical protein
VKLRAHAAGLVAVERQPWKSIRTPVDRRPAVDMTRAAAFESFKGLNGPLWPGNPSDFGVEILGGLASASNLERVKKYREHLSRTTSCDILWCEVAPRGPFSRLALPGFAFCGMDVVIGPLADHAYSIVLNEVVFGLHSELRSYAGRLNGFLLFTAIGDASELLETRQSISALPRAVLESIEESDFLAPVAIHMLQRHQESEEADTGATI